MIFWDDITVYFSITVMANIQHYNFYTGNLRTKESPLQQTECGGQLLLLHFMQKLEKNYLTRRVNCQYFHARCLLLYKRYLKQIKFREIISCYSALFNILCTVGKCIGWNWFNTSGCELKISCSTQWQLFEKVRLTDWQSNRESAENSREHVRKKSHLWKSIKLTTVTFLTLFRLN
mgnify:CR=1 FL=1